MISLLLTGTAVFLSSLLGAIFIKTKKSAAYLITGVTAVLAVALYWLTKEIEWTFAVPIFLLFLFIFEILILRWQTHTDYGSCFLGLCLSFGSFCSYVPLIRFTDDGFSLSLLLAFCILCTISVTALVSLSHRFPDSGWQESFHTIQQEESRLNIRLLYVYLSAAGSCIINILLLLIPVQTLSTALILCTAAFLLLWCGILLIILMTYYKKERLNLLLEQQYREETKAFMNVIRSQRHDYNFHVQTIAGLISGNKIEECKNYVKALEKDSIEMNMLMPIKDPAVSATIFSFQRIAIREGIELHTDIQYDMCQIASNVYETNKILSNLLKNAIDEVSTQQDKSYGIWLTILKRREFCVIQVSNRVKNVPTAQQLGQIYEQGYTTKSGHEGVGLSSIRLITAKYQGIIFTQMEGDVIHFTVRIPINAAKSEEY